MTKQQKYFFMVFSLFPLVPFAAWLFGPGTIAYKIVFYSVTFIFMCYWLWSVFFVVKGNAGFLKKIKSNKREEEK